MQRRAHQEAHLCKKYQPEFSTCFTISMGTLTRQAAISPSDAAAMCAAGAGREEVNVCLEVSYVQKKRAALGAEPMAAGPSPA